MLPPLLTSLLISSPTSNKERRRVERRVRIAAAATALAVIATAAAFIVGTATSLSVDRDNGTLLVTPDALDAAGVSRRPLTLRALGCLVADAY
jgi:hypothetical protein